MQSKLEISNLLNSFINIYKNIESEITNVLDTGLFDYLRNQTEKYYYVNTFLHRGYKVKFFDTYFPVKATHKLLKTDFKDLLNIFDEYKSILIIGSAGSGKSTLAKFIFLNSLKLGYKIPILIELRHLNDFKKSLSNYTFN